MLKTRLAVISAVHFALAPGVVVGLVPWAMTGWDLQTRPWSSPALRTLGAAMIAAGVAMLVRLFVRFVAEGLGTPAPVAPTRHLVVSGLYCYVRNPMYIGVVAAIVGQALLLGRAGLFVYAAAVWCTVAAFARWYEEPALHERFAGSYDEYRVAVPAWWPRMHPWAPSPRFDDA
ncbi:MAG TPA: isoprenylcysteine carboxylmethyltransferase family protein [Jiangellaceae bacterium]|jgi:protein-S-isoprenylcysteine O-methyltransferase Ste14|nr:isoprenylcysteine carboxylmethyltransferase family protein [Jiangellaceae bacterium]